MNIQPRSLTDLSLIKLSFPDSEKLGAVANVNIQRDSVTHAELEDSLKAISRRFDRFSLKTRALELYTNNRITLLGNKETIQVPMLLPCWRVRSNTGKVIGVVNGVPYVPASGIINLDVRTLFGLLVIGAVSVDSFDYWAKISSSMVIAKNGSIVYTRLMYKVIDRLTGIGMDRLRSDQIKYVLSKYFLINMLKRTPSEATDALARNVVSDTSINALIDFENALGSVLSSDTQEDIYKTPLLQFLDSLGKTEPWLNRLTARAFIQTYTSMYRPAALMAAEDATYLFAIMASHQAGSEIVSGYAFDPAFGREGDLVLDEFARLVV